MKVVLSGIFMGVVLVGGYILVTRLPWVMVYRDCYDLAYSIVNEEHNITRRAWVTDETICLEHKDKLLKAQTCFKEAEQKQPMSNLEKAVVWQLAQDVAKGTKTYTELVTDHNKRCTYRKTILDYDPVKDVWF